MTKISSASIRLVLKKNRSNSAGENPIYLVICFNGRKEVSTGVFINERYWNSNREEIRKTCPNAPVLNKIINDLKQKAISKRNEFEYHKVKYTPSMLLEEDVQTPTDVYLNLYKNYLKDMCLSSNTIRLYDYTFNTLKKYFKNDKFKIGDVNLSVIKQIIKSSDLSDNSIRGICGRIAAIWNYSIDKGIVPADEYPFKDWKYSQKYKKGNRTYYLEAINLIKMRDYFISNYFDVTGELFSHKDGVYENLLKRSTKEFALMFFLICYRLNGSAPIDVALLRADNCSRITVDGEDYWKVEFNRRKTNMPVVCLLPRDMLTMVCFELFLGRSRGGYIYPVLRDGMTDKQISNAMGKFSTYAVKWLREIAKEINQQTITNNVQNNTNDPLIDVESVCLYSARHSFGNIYLSQPGASVHVLATLMARSPDTISTYIHQLQSEKEIAHAIKGLI